jgi:hypothetical protein
MITLRAQVVAAEENLLRHAQRQPALDADQLIEGDRRLVNSANPRSFPTQGSDLLRLSLDLIRPQAAVPVLRPRWPANLIGCSPATPSTSQSHLQRTIAVLCHVRRVPPGTLRVGPVKWKTAQADPRAGKEVWQWSRSDVPAETDGRSRGRVGARPRMCHRASPDIPRVDSLSFFVAATWPGVRAQFAPVRRRAHLAGYLDTLRTFAWPQRFFRAGSETPPA